MPAPSTSTVSRSWARVETLSPWFANSAMIGPAIETVSTAGMTVMNGASTDRKIRNSKMRMKRNATSSTSLPVLPDCFC